MSKGTIKRLVSDKGFGFIQTAGGGKNDIFFHASGLSGDVEFDSLQEGAEVEFDETQGPKGPRAENVVLI